VQGRRERRCVNNKTVVVSAGMLSRVCVFLLFS
jgi:hypothetical protein